MHASPDELALLDSIQRRVLWLATYMVHFANSGRPNPDGTKVGGHQASSSSVVTLLTALYFKALRPGDVVAVKAHGSPALYAIEYLRGRLDADALRSLRTFGGLQSYPSRRKNPEVVELSTGSMGLGAVSATFSALAARYVEQRWGVKRPERVIAMVGDAELDEGNVWEALGEESVAELGNLLWIVDLNRQSLDRFTPDSRRRQLSAWFGAAGWRVIELRWGTKLRAVFKRAGGSRLRARLEAMSNAEYHALLRHPAGAVRTALVKSAGGATDQALDALLAKVSDESLRDLVADVGGHDLAAVLDAFQEAEQHRDRPQVIIADTIKGWGLPFAADPLNHGAQLTAAQIEELARSLGVAPGQEWAGFAPGTPEAELIGRSPRSPAATSAVADITVPDELGESYPSPSSTQEAFGRVLGRLARLPIGERVVTLSADVAVTTHLAGWINRAGVYFPRARPHQSETTPAVQWKESPEGRHIELGIAEHNLFLALGAFGLSRELSGVTLLPIGTLYDPFVTRGLDALYHALYAGGKFIVVATPSGVSLSPEGGAHQSVITPGIGIALPDMVYFDPGFAQEVEWILLEGLRALNDRSQRESLYLRLSTKPVDQSLAPSPTPEHREHVLKGGYRLIDARQEPSWDPEDNAALIFAAGAMVPEAVEANRALRAEGIFASVFVVTSPDRLYRELRRPHPHLETLVGADEEGVPIVSVIDGHSHALAFIGSALGVTQIPLGVDHFGQSGSRQDLYRHYGIHAEGIMRAVRTLLVRDSSLG
jgi:pyruvate dehydrogenase E1 component